MAKKAKDHLSLTREESDQLQMILDRLAVQHPEGESFDGYLHSLRSSLSGRPLLAAALIERLSRNPSQTGFRAFQALDKIIETSPYKRSLKQAAYRFSQKGFNAAVTTSAPEKVVLIHDEHRKPVAHLVLVPGTLWIVSALIPEASMGGYFFVTAFLEDDFDTFNVRVTEASGQKLYKEYLQVLSAHAGGGGGLEIPLRHAARLFFDMLDFWTGKASYSHLERARDLLKRYHEPDQRPYVYELMTEIENPERHFDELEIEELVKDMDLWWLRFGKEDLFPWYEKLKALNNPLLVVPPEVQVERGRELLYDAAESLCVGSKRYLFRRFFEEQAMVFKLSGAEDKARKAWIAAGNLAGQSPVGKNPVVLETIMYSIKSYWPEDFKAARQTEQTPERERRTESGIILP
jgi:hypothetical protein